MSEETKNEFRFMRIKYYIVNKETLHYGQKQIPEENFMLYDLKKIRKILELLADE